MGEHLIPRADPPALASLSAAIAELRRQIADMDQRIARQRKRVDRILAETMGPADAMQAVLEDMINARANQQARLEQLERGAAAGAAPAATPGGDEAASQTKPAPGPA